MNQGLKTLAMTLTGAMLIVSLGRCDGGDSDADTGVVAPKDGSVATQDTGTAETGDTGTAQAGDTGTAQTPDTGSTVKIDGGVTGVETTIPVINNTTDPGHAAFATYPNNKVHFKGIAVSPVFRDYKSTSGTDPKRWYCRMGIYLADPNATSAEYNGVLVTSEGSVLTVTADGGVKPGDCKGDSPLELLQATTPIAIGDEIEVTGFYTEDCYRTGGTSAPCAVVDQAGKGLARAVVEANIPSALARTGKTFPVPTSLPAKVTIDEVGGAVSNSTTTITKVDVGAKWWQYRQVLIGFDDLKVVDDKGASCNWTVQKSTGGATLIIQDDVMFAGTDCGGRPPLGTAIPSLVGLKTWYTSSKSAETQLAPRSAADYGWQVVKPDAGTMPPDAAAVEPPDAAAVEPPDAAAQLPDTGT